MRFQRIIEIVRARPPIDCLFCTNELSGIGAVVALRRSGFDILGRIAVAGFGDIETASLIEPPLTTVRIRAEEMGSRAASLLLSSIEDNQCIRHIVGDVGFDLADRGSA
jgi:LacI family transcriptional regulator, gluconate utilization system Gnt-I transcriptional repressor